MSRENRKTTSPFKSASALLCAVLMLIAVLSGCAENGAAPEEPSSDLSSSDSSGETLTDNREFASDETEKSAISEPVSEPASGETAPSSESAKETEKSTSPTERPTQKPAKPAEKPTKPAEKPTQPKPTQPPALTSRQQAEKILQIVNRYRKENGVGPLVFDEDLNAAAGIRVKEIQVSFSHTRPNGEICFTVSDKAYGENILYGTSDAEYAMELWMDSTGHRENILNPDYKTIGVAYENDHWVQLFGI